MHCEICGNDGPTQYVEFQQNIGIFFTRYTAKVQKNLCRICIGRCFRSYTLTTLFLGWWGLISLCVTPAFLLSNTVMYFGARHLPEPSLSSMNTPIGSALPSVASGSFKFKIIYGTILVAILLSLLASSHVDFMERYAPAINAKLHSGEISNESDSEYAAAKIGKDILALEAPLKSTKWPDMRSEMLSRKPYLMDLNAQNERFQRRIPVERSAGLGSHDVCEQLALDEFGPALNAYAVAANNLFSATKNTSVLTSTNAAAMESLADKNENALKQLRAYFTDSDKHGCK